MAARVFHDLSEMVQQMLIEASLRIRVSEDLLEAVEVLLFAAEEELLESLSKGVEVLGCFEESVALADAAGFEDEVAVCFKVGEGFDDALAVGVELLGGLGDVDGGPEAGFLAGGKEFLEEFAAFFVVAEENLVGEAEELEFVGRVKGGGGGDVAVEFEVGEEGVDDEGTDVVGAGELVEGKVEGLAGLEDLVEDAADGVRGGGVAVDEVFEDAEIVGAGEKFAGGGLAIASGAADFLGVVLERLGEVVVNDAADVGFVDAHAEGDGGGDDGRHTGHECFLARLPGFGAKAGVVGAGGEAFTFEERGEGLGCFLSGAVDDGGRAGVFTEAIEEEGAFVFF